MVGRFTDTVKADDVCFTLLGPNTTAAWSLLSQCWVLLFLMTEFPALFYSEGSHSRGAVALQWDGRAEPPLPPLPHPHLSPVEGPPPG